MSPSHWQDARLCRCTPVWGHAPEWRGPPCSAGCPRWRTRTSSQAWRRSSCRRRPAPCGAQSASRGPSPRSSSGSPPATQYFAMIIYNLFCFWQTFLLQKVLTKLTLNYLIKKKCSARRSSKSRTYQLIPTAARNYKTKYFVRKQVLVCQNCITGVAGEESWTSNVVQKNSSHYFLCHYDLNQISSNHSFLT